MSESLANAAPSPARRRVLSSLSLILGLAATALAGVPILGFVLAPVAKRGRHVWRNLGPLEQFPIGQTVAVSFENAEVLAWAGSSARSAAWLRRDHKGDLVAFAVNCTHLGCPVRWEPAASLFLCPCHGGVYYENGTVAAGPPPRPLPRYNVRTRDGQVEIEAGPIPIS